MLIIEILELDKNRSTARKPMLGGSLFSSSASSAPPELEPLVPLQNALTKAEVSLATSMSTSDTEYDKLTINPAPTPPVHAARLHALLKNLASAENAVSESMKARRALIERLENLIMDNKSKLASEEAKLTETSSRKTSIDTKRREVEDGIMRGLTTEGATPPTSQTSPGTPGMSSVNGNGLSHTEPERPTMEQLTPPPVESLTPVGSPKAPTMTIPNDYQNPSTPNTNSFNESEPNIQPAYIPQTSPPPHHDLQPGSDILSSLRMPPTPAQVPINRDPRLRHNTNSNSGAAPLATSISESAQHPTKKRKLAEDEFEGFGGGGDAMADLDDDVAALLRAESGGG